MSKQVEKIAYIGGYVGEDVSESEAPIGGLAELVLNMCVCAILSVAVYHNCCGNVKIQENRK